MYELNIMKAGKRKNSNSPTHTHEIRAMIYDNANTI